MQPTASNESSQCLPVLASTLFAYEQDTHQLDGQQQRQHDKGFSLRTGIRFLDQDIGLKMHDVLGTGRVVGFAGTGEMHKDSLTLIHNIIATHLLDTHRPSTSSPLLNVPTIFILEPPTTPSNNTSLLQVYDILQTQSAQRQPQQPVRLSKPQSLSADLDLDVDNLIDRISILPYFDLLGILQSLSEITEQLTVPTTTAQSEPQQAAAVKTTTQTQTSRASSTIIVLLRSLTQTLTQQVTRTGATTGTGAAQAQSFALLSQIFRQLRRLSQTHRSQHLPKQGGPKVLIFVEVGVDMTHETSVNTNTGSGGVNAPASNKEDLLNLSCAFSSIDGRSLKLCLDSQASGDSNPSPGTHTNANAAQRRILDAMARMVEDALDTVVILHDGFGVVARDSTIGFGGRSKEEDPKGKTKCIVEVVKDRAGGTLGQWTAWDL